MTRKVSLKDIAEKLGVSTALVSYALNNKKEGRINKEMAQKIRDTAVAMNYRTNQIAKSLKTNRTNTIGLIMADISNPFSSGMARIIEDEADKDQYTVLFGSSDENLQKFTKLIDTFVNRQVDGLIIAASEGTEPQIRYLQEQAIPFVLIDRIFPDIDTNTVAIDNFQASYTAVQHMADCGYRRIAMVTYKSQLFHMRERSRGYLSALKNNEISFKKGWLKEVPLDDITNGVNKVLRQLLALSPRPDALLFASNRITVLALKYFNLHNIKIPADLALVGFDETEAQDLFYAPLTYIKQPLSEMGKAATRMLIASIANNETIRQVKMDTALVVRKSTELKGKNDVPVKIK